MIKRRNVLESPRLLELKKKKRQVLMRKIFVFGFLFVLIIVGLTLLSRIQRLNINDIQVEGNKVIDSETVRELIQKEISGKYMWLFSKTNLFLYPKSKLKNALSNEFKRFDNIDLALKNKQTLMVSVTERTPLYMWCGNTPTLVTEQETCYFLDGKGYVFDEAPYFSGEVYFKFYGILDGKSETPPGSYVAQGYFANLIAFKETLIEMKLEPAILYIQEGGDIKIN